MRVTHFGHACVLVEQGSASILIDPGEWSDGFGGLRDLDGILITHKHADHLDVRAVANLARDNPGVLLAADPESAGVLRELDLPLTVVRPGDSFQIGDVMVKGVGGQHAMVHPEISILRNTGYLIGDGDFYHPGDSFFVPEESVDVLGLPTGGPWLKVSEVIDFLRLVAPRVALPIHERSQARPQVHFTMFKNLAPHSTEVRVPDLGTAMKI